MCQMDVAIYPGHIIYTCPVYRSLRVQAEKQKMRKYQLPYCRLKLQIQNEII